MKKFIYRICSFIFMAACVNILISCRDEKNEGIFDGESLDENIVEVGLNNACLIWDSSTEQIRNHMNGYELVESDEKFLRFQDSKNMLDIAYDFVNDSLRATVIIVPKLSDFDVNSYLDGYEFLGELSSKDVYYNNGENTMCFSYEVISDGVDYSVIGFAPIISDLYSSDLKLKVDYKNLSYTIDGKAYKMILVDGGTLPAFYMMQTEIPLLGEVKIGDTYIGSIDMNADQCIIKAELRKFIEKLNEATGLEFRLPTEDEWKFAAKGGVKSLGYTYSGSNNIDDVAWYNGNSNGLHDIALKQANELGFYDMSGNYEEVCSDSPLNIDGRTYGGCWKYSASSCTPTSWKSGNTSGKVPDKNIYEDMAVDGRYITVRLVYSDPE